MLAVRRFTNTGACRQALSARVRMASSQAAPEAGSRMHGSTHWSWERIFSAALLPSLGYAVVAGPNAINDMALGVLIPIHLHMGFDAIITDYIPKRNMRALNAAANWTLRFGTLAMAYGFWTLNTSDVGLTETFRRVWRAPQEQRKVEEAQKA
ncbi:membrane anchor subunit of succinate dehydrogenase, Sdh4 [Blastocladiella emersonii ATCC 22665]|nr:membrane anchor subunit of succinate dehydrogenase, Sdh4 [Blastocladiella emersonii ATCC 22665]